MSPKAKALAKEKLNLWKPQMSEPVKIANGYKLHNIKFDDRYYLVEIDWHLVLFDDRFNLIEKWVL